MSNNIVIPTFTNPDGIMYIRCKMCEEYKPETDFFKNNKRLIGRDSSCKLCKKLFIQNNPINDNARIEHNKLYDWEVDMARHILKQLGYTLDNPDNPVHQQFNKRHGF